MRTSSTNLLQPYLSQTVPKQPYSVKGSDTSDTSNAATEKKAKFHDSQPTSPATVLSISSTSVLVSSEGNLYRSNASWNKSL